MNPIDYHSDTQRDTVWQVPRGYGESTGQEGPGLQKVEQAPSVPQTQTAGLASFTQEAWIEAGPKEAITQIQEKALLDKDHRARCSVGRHREGQRSSSPGRWHRLVCDGARKGGSGQRAAATTPG